MAKVPTPNYCLSEPHSFGGWGQGEQKTLDAGAFVRPIKTSYVPQHVIEANKYFDNNTHVYCYTRYGIIPIPREIVRLA